MLLLLILLLQSGKMSMSVRKYRIRFFVRRFGIVKVVDPNSCGYPCRTKKRTPRSLEYSRGKVFFSASKSRLYRSDSDEIGEEQFQVDRIGCDDMFLILLAPDVLS